MPTPVFQLKGPDDAEDAKDADGFLRGNVAQASRGDINYKIWKSGLPGSPLVVAVHGLGGTMGTYASLAQELSSSGFDVLAFDLFGFGLSSSPHGRFNAGMFAEQTLELLALLGYPPDYPFYLMGFSMGGIVSMEVARRCPARVRRLLLIAPAGLVPLGKAQRSGIKALRAVRKLRIPAVAVASKLSAKQELNREDSEHFEPDIQDQVRAQELGREVARRYRSDPEKYAKAWLKSVRDMRLANSRELYRCIAESRLEVLFFWGDNDSVIPLDEIQDELRSFFPAAPLVVIPDAGHSLLEEHASTVAMHATQWLRGWKQNMYLPAASPQVPARGGA